jgi:hypothetical protein
MVVVPSGFAHSAELVMEAVAVMVVAQVTAFCLMPLPSVVFDDTNMRSVPHQDIVNFFSAPGGGVVPSQP